MGCQYGRITVKEVNETQTIDCAAQYRRAGGCMREIEC